MSLILNPATYSPVSAEIWLSNNSAGSGAYGFKYVYNVKTYDLITGASQSLGEYDIAPAPITGYGIFSPSKLLRTQTSYQLQPFINSVTVSNNGLVNWNVEYGQLFNPNILFTDIVFYIGANAWVACPYNILGPPNPNLVPGIDIELTLDNPAQNPQFSGACKIVSVYQIVGWQFLTFSSTLIHIF